jgi:hypothetical protein
VKYRVSTNPTAGLSSAPIVAQYRAPQTAQSRPIPYRFLSFMGIFLLFFSNLDDKGTAKCFCLVQMLQELPHCRIATDENTAFHMNHFYG